MKIVLSSILFLGSHLVNKPSNGFKTRFLLKKIFFSRILIVQLLLQIRSISDESGANNFVTNYNQFLL